MVSTARSPALRGVWELRNSRGGTRSDRAWLMFMGHGEVCGHNSVAAKYFPSQVGIVALGALGSFFLDADNDDPAGRECPCRAFLFNVFGLARTNSRHSCTSQDICASADWGGRVTRVRKGRRT